MILEAKFITKYVNYGKLLYGNIRYYSMASIYELTREWSTPNLKWAIYWDLVRVDVGLRLGQYKSHTGCSVNTALHQLYSIDYVKTYALWKLAYGYDVILVVSELGTSR